MHTEPTAEALAAEVEAAVTLAADYLADALPVNALAELAAIRGKVAQLEELAAVAARDQGHSWEAIGEAAGVTKQAAHKRFSTAAAARVEAAIRADVAAVRAQLREESTPVDPYGTIPAPELTPAPVDPMTLDAARELLDAVTQVREAEARVRKALNGRPATALPGGASHTVFLAARAARYRLDKSRHIMFPIKRDVYDLDLADLELFARRRIAIESAIEGAK